MEKTFRIAGQMTYEMKTVEIDETVEATSPETALAKILENTDYQFFGSLKTCDAETHGQKGATYYDSNEDQIIYITLEEGPLSVNEMYAEAARETNGQYKGYTGANALSLYVDDKYDVNAAASGKAHNALCEAMTLIEN